MNEKVIPLSVPNLRGNELKYVTAAIESEWISTAGSYVNKFEESISHYVNAEGAVSCQNGTSGLHISLIVSGVTNEDIVLVPTLTFIAAVNPVKYVGAEPIFMDCDESLCIDPVKLKQFCEEECFFEEGKLLDKNTGKYIKALLIVHVFGNMADMESIMEIAERFNLKVIEDATEALGTYYTRGKYKGKYAGTIGEIGVYSFNGNKIITTGGGGMIISNDNKLLSRAKHLTTQAKSNELYFTHNEVGYNYRMTNLQAALGLAQLEQLEDFIKIKNENYELYKKRLEFINGLNILPFREGVRTNKWFYSVFCDEGYVMDRDELIKYLAEKKIQTRPIWGLISEQKPYKEARAYRIEKALYYWKHVINVPCSTNLLKRDIELICDVM